MLVSGAASSPPPGAGTLSQLQALQVNFTYSKTSQYQVTGAGGQQVASFGSAVNISLSVTAIKVTTGVVAAEKLVNDTKPQPVNSAVDNSQTKNIENVLKDFFRLLVENGALTGKAAKRLSGLVSRLNIVRGTHDVPDQNNHKEVRSALKGNGAHNTPRETETAAEPKNEIETETEDRAPSAQINIRA